MFGRSTVLIVVFLSCPGLLLGSDAPELSISRKDSTVELSWPAAFRTADGAITRPFFELDRSADLQKWTPFGERLRDAKATEDTTLKHSIGLNAAPGFYRLKSFAPQISQLASDGSEVFGFADAFSGELNRLGQISVGDFGTIFQPPADYLETFRWDPTTARYWSDFNVNPNSFNQGKDYGKPGYRTKDYRLNSAELAAFQQNGFVVSARLGPGGQPTSDSFADEFYEIWFNDLPVFISTDAILQAWHRTYDSILAETEETYLFESLRTMLDEMSARLPA